MRKKSVQILVLLTFVATLAAVALAAVPEAPTPQVQTAPPLQGVPVQPGKPAWLTPDKEVALVEVRKILREARQVAEGIVAPSKPRELSPPEAQFTPQELSKMHLLEEIAKAQFRAGDFSASVMTGSLDYLAFAQLHYGQVQDAVRSIGRARLLEDSALSFVYALTQAGFIDAAIEVAETQIKKEPVNPRRHEASLFALIAREQARVGDARVREALQRAWMAAKSVGPPNDRALALVHVARAQRDIGAHADSAETIREALDTAVNAPRDRSTVVLRIIAVAQEENGDLSGSAKTLKQILEDEKSLKSSERIQRLAFQACDLALRGHKSSAMEMFQEAMKIADGLPVNERVKVWSVIGRWLVKSGNHEATRTLVRRMVDVAETISGEQIKNEALSAASGIATKVGDLNMALDIAASMKDGPEKALAMRWLAERLATATNSHDSASIVRKLSEAARDLSQSQLPAERSSANGMLTDIAIIEAVTGDVPLAVQTLKRITNQDYHQGSGAYPEIIMLLSRQGNREGARQVVRGVGSKSLQAPRMAFALQSLSRAYAESGASQEGLQWAHQMDVDFAKASILLGIAEGIMNRHGLERIEIERPEVMLRGRCSIN